MFLHEDKNVFEEIMSATSESLMKRRNSAT